MKVVILGDVCIDTNQVENTNYTSFGGPPMYMHMTLSKFADVQTTLVTRYGADFNQYKDDIHFLPAQARDDISLQYQNIVRNGKRTLYAHHVHTGDFGIDSNRIEEELAGADLIYFAPLIPSYKPRYVAQLFERVQEGNAVKIVLPQGYFRSFEDNGKVVERSFTEYREILHYFDFAIVSEEDAEDMDRLAKKWATETGCGVVVTRGKKPADVFTWDTVQSYATTPVPDKEVVDSTGAGEIFSAAFGYKYIENQNLSAAIEFAHKVAGWSLDLTPSGIKEARIEGIE